MAYTLYTESTPNPLKVHLMLEELAVDYTSVRLSLGKEEQKSPEFLKINPNGRIPVLVDHDAGDFIIIESGAILQYLAEKHSAYTATDPKGRSEVNQWLMWQMGGLGPMFGQLLVFAAAFENKIPEATARYAKETQRLLSVLNTRLDGRDFIAGDYSIADMACVAWIPPTERLGWDLGDWPNVKAWFDRITARPAFTQAVEALGSLDEEERMRNFRKATVGIGS